MNMQMANPTAKGPIDVQLTPDEALALTGVEFKGNPRIKIEAQRKIRNAFEKTFDFNAESR
ncbi:hypothetical protein F4V43_00965 [Paenibacillus spiritus]|uniref:Uncharacterized protein n=1 Tax=Paenibacillus spiritus TaxID=2496557 RepID=A0A5J5GLY0_9BACL|nr:MULTISPECIES: hypothetical protein [Paenibacillus]KAA9008484.1 hypothetical protein F4V43_00965 [Paenibacillus spiritus]